MQCRLLIKWPGISSRISNIFVLGKMHCTLWFMKVLADGLQVCDVIYVSYQEKENKRKYILNTALPWEKGGEKGQIGTLGLTFKYFYILNK